MECDLVNGNDNDDNGNMNMRAYDGRNDEWWKAFSSADGDDMQKKCAKVRYSVVIFPFAHDWNIK